MMAKLLEQLFVLWPIHVLMMYLYCHCNMFYTLTKRSGDSTNAVAVLKVLKVYELVMGILFLGEEKFVCTNFLRSILGNFTKSLLILQSKSIRISCVSILKVC